MATMNINVKSEAYEALKSLKKKGESFSDVILKHLRPMPKTCGELLDELERDFERVPLFDPDLIKQVKAGRGRRSNRPAPKR